MMRIGDLLLEQRKLRTSDLTQALAERAKTQRRLCSLLITRGLVDFDDGSRALGAQKGVASALAKHLANRDPALAQLLPAELGRSSCALPIGKTSGGALIVCVRDPARPLLAALQRATRAEIMMVIAPATRLEHLVLEQYGSGETEEFDVDLGSAINLPPAEPPAPDMDALAPESVRLALTDLDDDRVDKDPSQSGQMIPAVGRARTQPGRNTLPPAAPTLDATRLGLERAPSRDAATDLAMAFVAGRWVAGVVLAVRDASAIGYRSHGVQATAVDSIAIPLGLPSTIQRAIETRQTSVQVLAGPAQDRLKQLLGAPSTIAAAPVLVDDQVVAVIAVGDPIHGAIDHEAATSELGRLATVLGAAYHRIRHA